MFSQDLVTGDVKTGQTMTRVDIAVNGDVAKVKVTTFTPATKGDVMVNGVVSTIVGQMNGTVHMVTGKMDGIILGILTPDIRKIIQQGLDFVGVGAKPKK